MLLELKESLSSLLSSAFKLCDAFPTVHPEARVRFGSSALWTVFYVVCLLGLIKDTLNIINPQNLEIRSGVNEQLDDFQQKFYNSVSLC